MSFIRLFPLSAIKTKTVLFHPSLKHESVNGIQRNIGDPFLLLVVVHRDAERLGRLIVGNELAQAFRLDIRFCLYLQRPYTFNPQ